MLTTKFYLMLLCVSSLAVVHGRVRRLKTKKPHDVQAQEPDFEEYGPDYEYYEEYEDKKSMTYRTFFRQEKNTSNFHFSNKKPTGEF